MSGASSVYLSSAAAVAFSPVAIIIMILLCVLGKAKSEGTLYLIGGMVGTGLFLFLSMTIAGSVKSESGSPSAWHIVMTFALSALMFYLAINSWRSRPVKGEPVKEPKWVKGLQTMNPGMVFMLGGFMMVVNGKNLPLLITSGANIAHAGSSGTNSIIDVVIFSLVGSIGLAVPWLIAVFGGKKAAHVLAEMRDWLYRYGNIVLVVLFSYLGLNSLLQGIHMVQ